MTAAAAGPAGHDSPEPADPPRFDVCGPLPPQGVTLLEASAGTGKTFTIAAMVTRFVAEGTPIESILAVTFTRTATAELRSRVRDRLVRAEERLGARIDTGIQPAGSDPVDILLATGDAEQLAQRRVRMADAISSFDAATITTTHGFCHLVLGGLGVAGGVGPGAVLTEDAGDTVGEVVTDLLARHALRSGSLLPVKPAVAASRAALQNLDTPLSPAAPGGEAELQTRLAAKVREEVGRRLMESDLLTYDDLLVRLKTALSDPDRGPAACRLLNERYGVVLIDEFQDTDPTQWQIVKTAFGGGDTVLVLIGDPKQAIYSFRGGDVYCYLDAARSADHRFTLGENWRSDGSLLAACEALLSPLQLGHPEIPFRAVTAPPEHGSPGLVGAPVGAPIRFRFLDPKKASGVALNKYGVYKPSAERWIAGDVARDVTRLLASGALITREHAGGGRRVEPGDIAVLVRTNRQARQAEEALVRAGVPAVVGASDSVFASEGGRDWLVLLEALEAPAARSRAAAAALTPFVGMSAYEVATAGEPEWESVHTRLHRWSNLLRKRGVAVLYRTVLADSTVPARCLQQADGARVLTDLGHVAQLLHAEGSQNLLGVSALRAWLAKRVEQAGAEGEAEERTRRLDSDADAVQVLTIHRAKGLEFPVVYCPFLWDCGRPQNADEPVVWHDPDHAYTRFLDVGTAGRSRSFQDHQRLELDERRGEDLRLLYVALTRARHQVVLWWAQAYDCQHSPLGRVLGSRGPDGAVQARGARAVKDRDLRVELERRAAAVPGFMSIEDGDERPPAAWVPERGEPQPLGAATFDRQLDLAWRRTSYSAITADAHLPVDETVGSEPEDPGTTDEPPSTTVVVGEPDEPASEGTDRGLDEPVPLWGMPAGAAVGTFVHRILEKVDFAAEDLEADIRAAAVAQRGVNPVDVGDLDVLVSGLAAAIRTPLGRHSGLGSLRDLTRADRLDELGFELPLAGGEHPSGSVSVADISSLMAAHPAAAGHPGTDGHTGTDGHPESDWRPLAGYAARLAGPPLFSGNLRGYLTGSLDLVFRSPSGDGGQRFHLADYKTNRLAGADEVVTAWHYRPAALDAEMQSAHYPLQAILYSVALHRYLRWRLPGYEPERHLGSVFYLFLRGMTGADCRRWGDSVGGVFCWKPPAALVVGLSDLFDAGGAMRAGGPGVTATRGPA